MTFTIKPDTKITLYLKECYGCNKNNKYAPLRQFILDNKIKLDNFVVKRIELNPDWQKEAFALEIELPLLVFESSNGKKTAIAYSEFLKKINKQGGCAKPRTKSKGAELDRVADGTPSSHEGEVGDGEEKTN